MQEKLAVERREAARVRAKAEQAKSSRDSREAIRLRSAYENMIKFNSERDRENQKKEQLLKIAREQKYRAMVSNFQQAENIRFEAKANK